MRRFRARESHIAISRHVSREYVKYHQAQCVMVVRIFHVLGFASGREGRFLIHLKGVIPAMSYDSMMVMLTFGLFIVSFIGLIIVIIKSMKK